MKKKLVAAALCASGIGISSAASAVEVLFAFVDDTSYYSYGQELAGYVDALSGYNVTQVNLDDTVVTNIDNYQQIWVYDLIWTENDNEPNQAENYQNITNWYNALATKNMIVDGRILSSSSYDSSGKQGSENSQLIQNYATLLGTNGGGLVLGTDHDVFANSGMNDLAALLGIDPFTGSFWEAPYQAAVDPLSPLMANGAPIPCTDTSITDGCVADHSSTSFVPTGQQANGQFLTPAAYHGFVSTAYDNAAIASTFGSETFGTCGEPGQPECITPGVPILPTWALLPVGLLGFAASRRKARS